MDNQEIQLVKFEKEDSHFIKQYFPSWLKDNSIENIERMIEKWKESLCFCILYGKEKAGIITLGGKDEEELRFGILIREEFRKKGIANRAFEIIKQKAKDQGISSIVSSCQSCNLASEKLHRKVGFELVNKEINQSGNEMYRWQMKI